MFQTRFLVIIASLVSFLIGHWMPPLFSSAPQAASAPPQPQNKKLPPLSTTESPPNCSQKLDALDQFFNERRAARQRSMSPAHPGIKLFDQFEPEAVCLVEERFGAGDGRERHVAFGDGPKFLCGVEMVAEKRKKEGGCLVYSVGSNQDIKFENSVKKYMGCEIHTFDPTITNSTFVGHHVTNFHDWGLGTDGEKVSIDHRRGRFDFVSMSLETIVKDLGHQNRVIDIFKIDCEGCEWSVMPKVFAAIERGDIQIRQIQIELHQNQKQPPVPVKFWQGADKAKMRFFHKERNHWGCQGWKCLEYALIDEGFLREVHKKWIC